MSIWKHGLIGLSKDFVRKFRIKEDFVVLFYDDEKSRIGMKFTDNRDEEGAFRLITTKKGGP